MCCHEVFDYLEELADINSLGGEELCMKVCTTACKEIEAKLTPQADRRDIKITAAAAALANYRLVLRSFFAADDCITEFKAGDVSVKQGTADNNTRLDIAEKLLKEKLAELVPLCVDTSFALKSVRVEVRI